MVMMVMVIVVVVALENAVGERRWDLCRSIGVSVGGFSVITTSSDGSWG